MHRVIVLISLSLILAAGLGAQIDTAALYFKLLEAEEYDLDMFYSSELHRLYVQVDFEILKNELDPSYHYGVFLERDAQFQAFTISGQVGEHYRVNNLSPEHFVMGLTHPELLDWDSSVSFRGLYLHNFDELPENLHFRLWYYLRVPPFKLDANQKLTTVLDANQFWYPRNMRTKSKVNLRMITIPYISISIGNNLASQFDKQYSRIHTLSFEESVEQPSSLRFIRD
jgi:hypothetical protein